MVSVVLACLPAEVDELVAELHERGTTGIVELEGSVEAYFDTRAEAEAVSSAFPSREPRIVEHEARDYVDEFQKSWRAVSIGRRLWLAPSWEKEAPPEGRLRVEFQPGMACGSGSHPCTQMCLEALEANLHTGDSVLDVGVGSGIILMAAGALGAGQRAGCDIDHDAVVIASRGVQAALWTGSTKSVGGGFDVVVANISAPAVDMMLGELRRIALRTLILSGFRLDQVKPEWGPFEQTGRDGWVCLTEHRKLAGLE